MSAALQRIKALAEQTKGVGIDMSETSKGGGSRRLLPAGNALGRFIMYREFGNHPREYQGQAKPPAPVVRIGFALFGKGDPTGPDTPENLYHSVVDGQIKPGLLNSYDLVLGNNERSKTKVAFDKMNYKGTAKRFVEMLGSTFIVPVLIKKGNKADSKPYNDINWAGILPAHDPISGQPYNVPEVDDALYQVFLWDAPTKEDWDAMFIEGVNDKGQSKNFLQATCIKAVNFEGSALQQLLGGDLPDVGMVEEDKEDSEESTPTVPTAPAATAAVPSVPQATVASVPDVPFDGGVPATVTQTPAVPSIPSIPTIPSVPSVG